MSLLEMILYYESTAYLDLSDAGGMEASAWRALAHLMKKVGALICSTWLSLQDDVRLETEFVEKIKVKQT